MGLSLALVIKEANLNQRSGNHKALGNLKEDCNSWNTDTRMWDKLRFCLLSAVMFDP
jgi:hypothetical protein